MGRGESVTWHVISDVAGMPRSVAVTRPAGAADRWLLRAGGDSIEMTITSNGAAATSLRWSAAGAAPALVDRPDQLASLYSAPHRVGDASFKEAGGSMMGNEVVRVPAGNFRARHASIHEGTTTWHFYIARSVPGGVVKMEEFADGEESPQLTLELQEYKRVKQDPAATP